MQMMPPQQSLMWNSLSAATTPTLRLEEIVPSIVGVMSKLAEDLGATVATPLEMLTV